LLPVRAFLGLKYKDGVILLADTLGSYGSMSMFKSVSRIVKVNDFTLLGAGGEYSDFQYLQRVLHDLTTKDFSYADGAVLNPKEIHSYLSRVLYNRRSKVNPLWNSLITAGFRSGESFLGFVDLYGSNFTADILATGYGQHLALPLLRKYHRLDLTFDEAKELLESCMKVLIYRDTKTLNSFQLATITAEGPKISDPYSIPTFWEYKRFIDPHKA